MLYDQDSIQVEAGEQVGLLFVNDDNMVHNIVFVKPGGFEETVGMMADQMALEADAQERQYIPGNRGILFLFSIGRYWRKLYLEIHQPSEKGNYPYLCTFPGHWRIMRGLALVVK